MRQSSALVSAPRPRGASAARLSVPACASAVRLSWPTMRTIRNRKRNNAPKGDARKLKAPDFNGDITELCLLLPRDFALSTQPSAREDGAPTMFKVYCRLIGGV
eukprot:IDg18655t1